MHKLSIFVLFLALGLGAQAQETPRVEVFTGYSFVSAGFPANPDPAAGSFRGSLNGWNGAAAFNVNRALGIVADFGGYYGSPTKGTLFKPANCVLCTGNATATLHNMHTFTFGPQVSLRSHDLTVFAHGLFGGAHINEDMSFFAPLPKISTTSFAVIVGGGVDVRLSSRWVIRFQPDYLRTKILDRTENDFRFSTGLVFRFGE
ncbi:MAG TPA: outer membrane beta-barrel protein [Candidatus Angelobacter sp.]|nr:outer membrane beta-barrel protein [Candidatus Angelobacter sp.]